MYALTLTPVGGAPPDAAAFDVRVRVNYTGDCARLLLGAGVLIEDNFYNGRPFDLGLTRYAPGVYGGGANLTLLVMPLAPSAPVYMVWPAFGNATALAAVHSVDVVQVWDAKFEVTA